MSQKFEQVVSAIKKKAWSLDLPLRDDECIYLARAAIEEMREPSPEMLQAMEPWTKASGHQDLIWRAGIDEALK